MAYDSSSFKPQVDEVGQIILRGRDRLANAPMLWKQSNWDDEPGSLCVLMACDLDYTEVRTRTQKAAVFRIARELGYRANRVMQAQDRIVAFNDHPDTTQEMAVALLDRAASPTKEA